jgi:rhomboid protease GluP
MSHDPQQAPPRSPHPLSDPHPESPQETPPRHSVRVRFPGTAKVPYVTYVLLAINIALFAMRYFDLPLASRVLEWGVASAERVLIDRELYRLLSAMFLHLNEAHILFNSIALYYIGANVEYIFGHVRFLLIYLLGGLAGSVLMILSGAGGLGASGAVFAIWGAEAVFFYQHRLLFGEVATARLRNSLLMMVMNFLIGFSANVANQLTNSALRISNEGHLGGLIGGALLAWLISPRFVPVPRAVSNPDDLPFVIQDINPLAGRVRELLLYGSGLAALILLAIVLRS